MIQPHAPSFTLSARGSHQNADAAVSREQAAAYVRCIICLQACTSATVRGMSLTVVLTMASADRDTGSQSHTCTVKLSAVARCALR